jgi:ABC-type multidrug transport system ATPase subunit
MKQLLTVDRLRISRSMNFGLHINKLRVTAGTVLCVVGPNGSGKTTLVECLTGLLTPPIGTVMIDGVTVDKNLRATKRLLGFVPDDENWFVKELCSKEYFSLLEGIYKQAGVATDMKARVAQIAAQLYFTSFEQPLGQLSHGNKKKVQIIAGLMHKPKILIVDELRNGLDPLAIIAAEKLIQQEAKNGTAIVAATHDLWWAQRIADEVLLLLDGAVASHQKTITILERHGSLENLFKQTVKLPD